MTIFDFMNEHWFLAFLMIVFGAEIIETFLVLLNNIFAKRPILMSRAKRSDGAKSE